MTLSNDVLIPTYNSIDGKTCMYTNIYIYIHVHLSLYICAHVYYEDMKIM